MAIGVDLHVENVIIVQTFLLDMTHQNVFIRIIMSVGLNQ